MKTRGNGLCRTPFTSLQFEAATDALHVLRHGKPVVNPSDAGTIVPDATSSTSRTKLMLTEGVYYPPHGRAGAMGRNCRGRTASDLEKYLWVQTHSGVRNKVHLCLTRL